MFRTQATQQSLSDAGSEEVGAAAAATNEIETGVPDNDLEPTAKPETSTDTTGGSMQGEEKQSALHYSNDLGLWADAMPTEMRTWWIEKGSGDCQHKDADFRESAVRDVSEKFMRHCSDAYFSKAHSLTGEKIERTWLCYSPTTTRLYCFACKLTKQSNAFTSGFNNWRKGEKKISAHESSVSHRDAMIELTSLCASKGRVDHGLVKQYEDECSYWRKVLKRAVSVICLLAERSLAFRGSDQLIGSPSNGNYLGILELLSQYDTFLAEHIGRHANKGRGHTSYLSSTVCEELINVMGQKVLDVIIAEVKAAKFFSISVDSTPDVSHTYQLTVVIRYVTPRGPVERFLSFLPIVAQHTGQEMADMLFAFFDEHQIGIRNCRGQSYDNAANMSGKYSGMQSVVREKCEYAHYVPCTAHSLNLVGKCAAESCSAAVSFFDFLKQLHVFFSGSTARWRVLKESCDEVVKQLSGTRWSERADAVGALVKSKGYEQVQEALDILADDTSQTPETRGDASGLAARMDELDTGIMAELWYEILRHVNKVSLALQDPVVALNTAVDLLKSLVVVLQEMREQFDEYEKRGIERVGHGNYKAATRRIRKRNRAYDERTSPETVLDPRERFRVEVFLVIVDSLVASLNKRLSAYQVVSNMFGFLGRLQDIPPAEVVTAAEVLVMKYPEDLESDLSAELTHFVKFLDTIGTDKLQDYQGAGVKSSRELLMFLLLHEQQLTQTFPNVEIMLRIYLSMMVSNCSGERTFSKMGIIKSVLRSTTGQQRLNMLSLMSIERDVLREIDFDDVIDDFARIKARKVSLQT